MTGKAFLLKIELSKLYFTGVITRSLDGGHTTTTLVMTNLTTATKPEPSTAKTATNTKKKNILLYNIGSLFDVSCLSTKLTLSDFTTGAIAKAHNVH